jgi:Domain of unknown function (DUF4586)
MGKSKKDGINQTGVRYGKTDLVRMGVFMEGQYISSGEQFNGKKSSALDYRSKGKQFLTAPVKKGHDSKDAYFDKEFVRVFEVTWTKDRMNLTLIW